MTSIADNAFEGCSALREVTLPSTLKTLNYACFGWCGSLTNIVLPEGTEKLDWSVFCHLHQPVVRDHPQQCENDRRLRIQQVPAEGSQGQQGLCPQRPGLRQGRQDQSIITGPDATKPGPRRNSGFAIEALEHICLLDEARMWWASISMAVVFSPPLGR